MAMAGLILGWAAIILFVLVVALGSVAWSRRRRTRRQP